MITTLDCPQRSPEWFQARLGRVTGSVAADILARLKNGDEAASRRDLRVRLALERLTGVPQDGNGYVSAEMQRGIDLEPTALANYEAITGTTVRRTGFIQHTALPVGCSLDGDVNDLDGIVELKCPKSATHLKYLRDPQALVTDYAAQVTHNLWVTEAHWADLVSFDDRFPPALQLLRVRVPRDQEALDRYAVALRLFLAEVNTELAALQQMMETR